MYRNGQHFKLLKLKNFTLKKYYNLNTMSDILCVLLFAFGKKKKPKAA